MKRISLFVLSALLLTACSSNLTVADKDTLKAYPELEGAIWAWQSMVDSAAAEDCKTFLENMRLTLKLTEEACPAAFKYFEEAPIVDWSRTDWSSSGGKAKIYEMGSGSIASFILNEADNSWRADEIFWED